jgi:SAM-dependent methyltransferase
MTTLENRYCPVCGPHEKKLVKYPSHFDLADLNAEVFSARRSPDRKHFRIAECQGCQLLFSDPACKPELLAGLYEKGTVTYDDLEQQIFASYAPVLDRGLARIQGKRGSFLEVGGGRGFMLNYGVKNGFSSQIEIEPSSEAEQKFQPPSPQATFIRDILIPGKLPANSVSMACFFQILDHVPDPLAFMHEVYNVLEPGGVAVGVTHNTRALSARFLGRRSPIIDIEHTYLFNPENMRRLFEKVGFEKTETFGVANRYALGYWLHLAPLSQVIKRYLSPLVHKTGLGAVRVNLRAGNFAIIAQKPLEENAAP